MSITDLAPPGVEPIDLAYAKKLSARGQRRGKYLDF